MENRKFVEVSPPNKNVLKTDIPKIRNLTDYCGGGDRVLNERITIIE